MMIPTGLLQPHTESEYLKLEQMYFELGNFIRSLWVHTEGEDKGCYDILKRETRVLSSRINEKIIVMDAFEQNDLKRFESTLPIDSIDKEKKPPGNSHFAPNIATPEDMTSDLERKRCPK